MHDNENGICDDAEFLASMICDEENSMFVDDAVCDECVAESVDYETSVLEFDNGYVSVQTKNEVDTQDIHDCLQMI